MFNIDVNVNELKMLEKDNIIGFEFSGTISFFCGNGSRGSVRFNQGIMFSTMTTVIQNRNGGMHSAFKISMPQKIEVNQKSQILMTMINIWDVELTNFSISAKGKNLKISKEHRM